MQQMITAVFDTARHAQIAVDDLLGSEIPSASIHQYRLVAGAEPEMAIQPENELHRPMSPGRGLSTIIRRHPQADPVKWPFIGSVDLAMSRSL